MARHKNLKHAVYKPINASYINHRSWLQMRTDPWAKCVSGNPTLKYFSEAYMIYLKL